jgi:hypothetical protein
VIYLHTDFLNRTRVSGKDMSDRGDTAQASVILQNIETLIARMQKIQRAIGSTGEPASQLEIEELKELGQHYTQLVKQLEAIAQQ